MTRKRRLALIAGTAVILAIVLLAVILIPGAGRMDALLEEWKAAGGAETAAALKPESIPDERNAAVLYRKAFEQYDSLSESAQAAILSMELNAESRAALDQLAEAIDLAECAASLPECQWDSPIYDQGLNAVLPHFGHARNFARVLALEAERAAEEGDIDRAVELLTTMRQLGRHIQEEPVIAGALFAMSIDHLALAHFRRNFAHRDLPQDRLDVYLTSGFDDTMLSRVVLTEGSIILETMLDEDATMFVFARDAEFFVTASLRVLEQFEKPHDERDLAFLEQDAIPLMAQMSRRLLPAWRTALHRQPARWETINRLAHAAVELRRYRDEHAEYPTKWDMPTDPITGEPMHYQRTDDGFILRSDAEFDGERITWGWQ